MAGFPLFRLHTNHSPFRCIAALWPEMSIADVDKRKVYRHIYVDDKSTMYE